ncbi:unnamed protein product [Brassica rapa subsp. narinosa]
MLMFGLFCLIDCTTEMNRNPDRSSIGSHDPSRPKMFIFICTSNCSHKGI